MASCEPSGDKLQLRLTPLFSTEKTSGRQINAAERNVRSISGTIAGVGQVTALGEHTWDGRGNTVATNTISANGNILNITVIGTYTVNSDCTASMAESDGTHYKFVVAPDGNTASWIEIDPGTVVSSTEARMKARDGEDED